MLPNRLAYIRDISIHHEYADIGRISFNGVAPYTPEILGCIQKWMHGSWGPATVEEWLCLYCGSANKLGRTDCQRCSAPRNWLI